MRRARQRDRDLIVMMMVVPLLINGVIVVMMMAVIVVTWGGDHDLRELASPSPAAPEAC